MRFSGRPSTFFMLLASAAAAPQKQLYPILTHQTDTMGLLIRRDPFPKDKGKENENDDGNGKDNGKGKGKGNGKGNSKDTSTTENGATPTEIPPTPGEKDRDPDPITRETPPDPPPGPIAAPTPSPPQEVPPLTSLSTYSSTITTTYPATTYPTTTYSTTTYPLTTYSTTTYSTTTSSSSAPSVTPTPTTTLTPINIVSSLSTLGSPTPSSGPSSESTPTPKNNTATTIGAVIGSLLFILVLSFLGFFIWKKAQRRKEEDEEWVVARPTTKEKQPDIPPPDLALPSPTYAATLPSRIFRQTRDTFRSNRDTFRSNRDTFRSNRDTFRSSHVPSSHQIDEADEPDEIMYIPPVEPSRVVSVDVVPSPIFAVPRTQPYSIDLNLPSPGLSVPTTRKQVTSFGSYNNEDPFAGDAPVKSPTLSFFGPGQAGVGAGAKVSTDNETAASGDGEVKRTSQLTQSDNTYTPDSQDPEQAYGQAL